MDAVDISHRDGSLKDIVAQNLSKYIILDKKIPEVLERFKAYGKKLWVITNSDYAYTKRLLDYTLNPCLKNHKDWTELFELVVTLANKPRFFTDDQRFLKVDDATGMMSNVEGRFYLESIKGETPLNYKRTLILREMKFSI
jgi:DNA mismatch repair ATPase MutS